MRGALPLLLALWGGAAQAQAPDCRLALVLALDVSSSVDEGEDRLQREGLARALEAEGVTAALLAGDPVALHAFAWSARGAQAPLLPGWVVVETRGDVARVAGAIRAGRPSGEGTSTALGFAAAMLAQGPDCRARTVDVAGDGTSNEGPTPAAAYEAGGFEGVTVNALIVADPALGREAGAQTIAWFQSEVLRGPGAFSVVAEGYGDYARAMEAKLLRELALPAVGGGLGGGNAG